MLMVMLGLAIAGSPTGASLPQPVIGDLFDYSGDRRASLPPSARADAGGDATVALRWPGPVVVTVETADGDVIARYDRPLDAASVAAFADAVGTRIERFDWGPDNLVLRGRPDQRLTASIVPGGLDVRFETLPANADAPASGDATAIDLLRAEAEAAAGYPARARRRLAAAAAARPRDGALQASLASGEYASGRVEDAAARYRTLPDGGGSAGRVAARAIGPAAEGGALVRDGRGFGQTEAVVRVGAPLSERLRIEAAARHVRSRGDDPAGGPARLRSDAVEGGVALAARVAADVRLRFDLTALIDADVVGAGLAAAFGDPERRGTLRLAYHLPDLTTSPGALLGGWIDRAGIGGGLRLAPGVTLRVEGGAIRYGLIGAGWRVRSMVAEGGVEWLVRRRAPTFALGYRFDGEYVVDRRDPGGAYAAIDDRENHIVESTVGQPIGDRLVLTGVAGWTVNRYGGSGPIASIGLSLVPVDGWEASLTGGISSISRAGVPDRQRYGRIGIARRFAASP